MDSTENNLQASKSKTINPFESKCVQSKNAGRYVGLNSL